MRLATFRRGDHIAVGAIDGESIRVLEAPSMLAWLEGEGRDETGVPTRNPR